MSKPSILPPSMREDWRYIVFEVISENPIDYSDLTNAIWVSSLNFIGDLGTSKTKVWVIKNLYEEKNQKGIIKCRQEVVEQVRAILSLISFIGDNRTIINVLGVTGTIKSAKKKYLKMSDLEDFSEVTSQ